jgi:hypothetical protein
MTSDGSTPTPDLPLAAVQLALHRTTEFLAHELAQPHPVAPEWSEFEWRIARAAATIHGVTGLMAVRTRWLGPQGWRPFLSDQRLQIARRQARMQALVQEVDARARMRGVALVALKGAALHAQGIYSAGERPMADLDLLVSEANMARATALLTELGFSLGYVTWKHHTFEPIDSAVGPASFGEGGANSIKIELHSRIREILPLRPVDLTALVWPTSAVPGINGYASRASLLLHVLLHASGSLPLRAVRLLHLQDIARLIQGTTEADWDELFRQAAVSADPSLWWAYPPLQLTDRYFGCVPRSVLERLASGCHWQLRRAYRGRVLSDVSLSHLWISAFPGIEWSSSLREMLAYAVARVWPRPETLALREKFAEVQPLVSGGEWAHSSQGRRILRWLLARQPRQESLQPVRISLAHPLS